MDWLQKKINENFEFTKDVIQKANSGMDIMKAQDFGEDLEKAKYIRREGSPGNYKYTYKESGLGKKGSPGKVWGTDKGSDFSESEINFIKKHAKTVLENHDNSPWKIPMRGSNLAGSVNSVLGLSVEETVKLMDSGVLSVGRVNDRGYDYAVVKFRKKQLRQAFNKLK